MEVEGGNRLELQHVGQVEPHRLPGGQLDGEPLVEARHPIPGHDGVARRPGRGEPGQNQQHLLGGGPPTSRINDQHPVQPAGDVLGERWHMAVVGVEAGRAGLDLVDGLSPRRHRLPPVVEWRVASVEVEVVGTPGEVAQPDPQQLPLVGT